VNEGELPAWFRRREPTPPRPPEAPAPARKEAGQQEDQAPAPLNEGHAEALDQALKRPSGTVPVTAAASPESENTPPAPPREQAPAGTEENDKAEPDEGVIVLKSGSIGGMAYKLYSDGSIEAELPDGVLRFASIQELRDHVASGAASARQD